MEYRREINRSNLPTNYKFGWFFSFVFALSAVYAFWENNSTCATLLTVTSVVFAILTLFTPKLLAPLNRLWFELGMLLGKIISPIVLGLIFFVLITPVALVTRLFGRDALLLKKRNTQSYWIERDPVGPAPESFKNQF